MVTISISHSVIVCSWCWDISPASILYPMSLLVLLVPIWNHPSSCNDDESIARIIPNLPCFHRTLPGCTVTHWECYGGVRKWSAPRIFPSKQPLKTRRGVEDWNLFEYHWSALINLPVSNPLEHLIIDWFDHFLTFHIQRSSWEYALIGWSSIMSWKQSVAYCTDRDLPPNATTIIVTEDKQSRRQCNAANQLFLRAEIWRENGGRTWGPKDPLTAPGLTYFESESLHYPLPTNRERSPFMHWLCSRSEGEMFPNPCQVHSTGAGAETIRQKIGFRYRPIKI